MPSNTTHKEWFACQNMFPLDFLQAMNKGGLDLHFWYKWMPMRIKQTEVNSFKEEEARDKDNKSSCSILSGKDFIRDF